MKIKVIIAVLIIAVSVSCASMFNGVVLPNQCKRCAVIVKMTNDTIFKNEGCGSENTRLEEDAKVQAYDLSRNSYNMCDLELVCESWRKDTESTE